MRLAIGVGMQPLRFAMRVATALVGSLPVSGVTSSAAFGALLLRPGLLLLLLLLLSSACAIFLLLLLLAPERFRLELVPLAANVFKPVVTYVST
jgi:hypothetical protein